VRRCERNVRRRGIERRGEKRDKVRSNNMMSE
jgi:hypothetical protein